MRSRRETRALITRTCHNLVVVSTRRIPRHTALAAAPSAVGVVAVNAGASDPGSTRLVYAMVIGLALIGVAFVLLAVWLIRQTRAEPEVLAPLERMGDSDWRRKDPATQRRLLDESRPEGATPIHTEPAPPSLDDEFEHADESMRSLDDLDPLQPERGGGAPTPADGMTTPDDTVAEGALDAADTAGDDEVASADDPDDPPDATDGADATDEADPVQVAVDDEATPPTGVLGQDAGLSADAQEPAADVGAVGGDDR